MILGFFIGFFILGDEYWHYGLLLAILCWSILAGITFLQGEEIILRLAQAKPANRERYPMLHNVAKEMQIAANLPFTPSLFVVDENAPNAFATGKSPHSATIVVTTGLLDVLSRDELQGVVAHEMSHILNRDILFMTHASVMLGSIVFLSKIYLRGLIYSGGGNSRKRSMNRGTAMLFFLSIFFSLLSPLVANILYFSISKKREFLADASAVRLTRYPYGLLSALQKISNSDCEFKTAQSTLSAFYISDPFAQARPLFNCQTHPPIEKRIEILQSLTHDVNYFTYQKAYSRICGKLGKNSNIIPNSAFHESAIIPVIPFIMEEMAKQDNIKPKPTSKKSDDLNKPKPAESDEIKTMIPNQQRESYRANFVPPRSSNIDKDAKAVLETDGSVVYYRKGAEWESFACVCGNAKHLSPTFKNSYLFCTNCRATINIVNYQEKVEIKNIEQSAEKPKTKRRAKKVNKKA